MGLQIENFTDDFLGLGEPAQRADEGVCPRRYRLPGAYDQDSKVWLGAQALRRVTLLIGSEEASVRQDITSG